MHASWNMSVPECLRVCNTVLKSFLGACVVISPHCRPGVKLLFITAFAPDAQHCITSCAHFEMDNMHDCNPDSRALKVQTFAPSSWASVCNLVDHECAHPLKYSRAAQMHVLVLACATMCTLHAHAHTHKHTHKNSGPGHMHTLHAFSKYMLI